VEERLRARDKKNFNMLPKHLPSVEEQMRVLYKEKFGAV
jgi:hypothetical protein